MYSIVTFIFREVPDLPSMQILGLHKQVSKIMSVLSLSLIQLSPLSCLVFTSIFHVRMCVKLDLAMVDTLQVYISGDLG